MLVYLSVTDKTPERDAAAFSKDADGNINDPEQFMMEDKDYYLYVYNLSTAALLKTHAFHTQAMPTGAEIAALPQSAGFGVSSFPGLGTSIGTRDSETMILPGRIGKTIIGAVYQMGGLVYLTCNFSSSCFAATPGNVFDLKRFNGELSIGSDFRTTDAMAYFGAGSIFRVGASQYRDGTGSLIDLFSLVNIGE